MTKTEQIRHCPSCGSEIVKLAVNPFALAMSGEIPIWVTGMKAWVCTKEDCPKANTILEQDSSEATIEPLNSTQD